MVNYVRLVYYLQSSKRRIKWNSKKLERYRTKKLREIVKHAYYNVPFYHELMNKCGINPSDVKSRSDLNKIPIITKTEIRENFNDMISTGVERKQLIRLSTSGSTGNPLILYVSNAEDEFRKAGHLRANIICGQKIRDRWATISGSGFYADTGLSFKLQEFLRFYFLHRIPVFLNVSQQLSFLKSLDPQVLEGYSSSLLLLAKEIKKLGLQGINPRIMFSGAELIDDFSRSFIEEVFDAPLYDHYATIEFERMAWQCPQKDEYHIDADSLIMQFVDKEGEEVASGEKGEVVCTSLFNYAMPLIRYSVGDIGVPSDHHCSCGIAFPMMKVLEGRKDSFLIFPDGRLVSPRSFTVAIRQFESYFDMDRFRIIQKTSDLIEVIVKLEPRVVDRESFKDRLASHMDYLLGLTESGVKIRVRLVDDISLDKSGKLMAVSSELKKS